MFGRNVQPKNLIIMCGVNYLNKQQVCIPVGCVPPACWPYWAVGGSASGGRLGRPLSPLVNRMTDRCKNITLPQTSFAGSKYMPQRKLTIL